MISPFYFKHNGKVQIHVFKTNLKNNNDVKIISKSLRKEPRINQWSVDLEDIDKVLRIEARKNLSEAEIIKHLTLKGFCCEALE